MIKLYIGPVASGFLAIYLSPTPYLKMKKFGYAAAGVICAVLMFVFVILPRMEPVEAANAPTLEYVEVRDTKCWGPCHKRAQCTGECDEDEDEECCYPGNEDDGGSCMLC